MTFRTLLIALAPLLFLAACATPDTSIDATHPAHPDAPAAPVRELPQTLKLDSEGAPAPLPGAADSPASEGSGALWTCPMHPEVVARAPGDCPICGMTLEPKDPDPAKEEPHDHH